MVQIVPDEYFPPTKVDVPVQRTTAASRAHRSLVGLSSSAHARLLYFSDSKNETLCDAVDAITSLMQMGDLEGACQLAERGTFHVDMVAVNGTLLIGGINMLLGLLADPVYDIFQRFLYGYAMDEVGMAQDSNLSYSDKNAPPVGVVNLNVTSDTLSPIRLFCINTFLDNALKTGTGALMFLFCTGLCILFVLVHVRFEKYFHGIDELAAQHYGGSDAVACHGSRGAPQGHSKPSASHRRKIFSKHAPPDTDDSDDSSEGAPPPLITLNL